MVHKTSILPGLSNFIDTTVLSQYPPTSVKRIVAAGVIALYLKQNASVVDNIINNPLIEGLHVSTPDGLINLEAIRDVYKNELQKAGYMRLELPMLGAIDFTPEDVDALYRSIVSVESAIPSPAPPSVAAVNGGLVQ